MGNTERDQQIIQQTRSLQACPHARQLAADIDAVLGACPTPKFQQPFDNAASAPANDKMLASMARSGVIDCTQEPHTEPRPKLRRLNAFVTEADSDETHHVKTTTCHCESIPATLVDDSQVQSSDDDESMFPMNLLQ